jgi:hypothetical protein
MAAHRIRLNWRPYSAAGSPLSSIMLSAMMLRRLASTRYLLKLCVARQLGESGTVSDIKSLGIG